MKEATDVIDPAATYTVQELSRATGVRQSNIYAAIQNNRLRSITTRKGHQNAHHVRGQDALHWLTHRTPRPRKHKPRRHEPLTATRSDNAVLLTRNSKTVATLTITDANTLLELLNEALQAE